MPPRAGGSRGGGRTALLVQNANAKQLQELVAAAPPELVRFSLQRADRAAEVRSYTAASLPQQQHEWAFQLVRDTLKELYEPVWGWKDESKREQLRAVRPAVGVGSQSKRHAPLDSVHASCVLLVGVDVRCSRAPGSWWRGPMRAPTARALPTWRWSSSAQTTPSRPETRSPQRTCLQKWAPPQLRPRPQHPPRPQQILRARARTRELAVRRESHWARTSPAHPPHPARSTARKQACLHRLQPAHHPHQDQHLLPPQRAAHSPPLQRTTPRPPPLRSQGRLPWRTSTSALRRATPRTPCCESRCAERSTTRLAP